ncbi:MAG: FERM, ARHGEF and pleckstrin domain-containing protein 1 [Marteilia pararefringens]
MSTISQQKSKHVYVFTYDDKLLKYSYNHSTKGSGLFSRLVKDCELSESQFFSLEFEDISNSYCWLDMDRSIESQVERKPVQSSTELSSSPLDHTSQRLPTLSLSIKYFPDSLAQLKQAKTRHFFVEHLRRFFMRYYCSGNSYASRTTTSDDANIDQNCGENVVISGGDMSDLAVDILALLLIRHSAAPHEPSDLRLLKMQQDLAAMGFSPETGGRVLRALDMIYDETISMPKEAIDNRVLELAISSAEFGNRPFSALLFNASSTKCNHVDLICSAKGINVMQSGMRLMQHVDYRGLACLWKKNTVILRSEKLPRTLRLRFINSRCAMAFVELFRGYRGLFYFNSMDISDYSPNLTTCIHPDPKVAASVDKDLSNRVGNVAESRRKSGGSNVRLKLLRLIGKSSFCSGCSRPKSPDNSCELLDVCEFDIFQHVLEAHTGQKSGETSQIDRSTQSSAIFSRGFDEYEVVESCYMQAVCSGSGWRNPVEFEVQQAGEDGDNYGQSNVDSTTSLGSTKGLVQAREFGEISHANANKLIFLSSCNSLPLMTEQDEGQGPDVSQQSDFNSAGSPQLDNSLSNSMSVDGLLRFLESKMLCLLDSSDRAFAYLAMAIILLIVINLLIIILRNK